MTGSDEDPQGEMAALRSEIDGLRDDIATRGAELMMGLRRELHEAIRRRNREMVVGLAGVLLLTLVWTWVLARFVV